MKNLKSHPITNPFATRWTRPGAIPFLFSDTMTMDEVAGRLRSHDWRGAIVGPHGSGKSTLVAVLAPAIAALGKQPVLIRLHDGQRRLPGAHDELGKLGASDVLMIDGYEQLSRFERWRLSRHCHRRRAGLLVTAHAECGLPVLFRTEPSFRLVEQLIEEWLPPHDGQISSQDVERAWRRHPGNVREVFFDLYDRFESRRKL